VDDDGRVQSAAEYGYLPASVIATLLGNRFRIPDPGLNIEVDWKKPQEVYRIPLEPSPR
jgi:hypothetical protein